FDCNAGKATLTTVPSMNAMLEPRIVAASTHGRDFSTQGAAKAPARITASSHGCFISNLDAYGEFACSVTHLAKMSFPVRAGSMTTRARPSCIAESINITCIDHTLGLLVELTARV